MALPVFWFTIEIFILPQNALSSQFTVLNKKMNEERRCKMG
jgi:hypothetical protein